MRKSTYGLLVLLSIGLVMPALILGGLGLRSFRYERLLLHKQNQERYNAVADALAQRASGLITDWIGAMQAWSSILVTHRLGTLPVENLWQVNDRGEMIAPVRIQADPTIDPPVLEWGSLADEISRLETLEISQHRVADARRGYQALVRDNSPLLQRIELSKMIAADDRKLGLFPAAEDLYIHLRRDHDQIPDASGLPTGLIASTLLAQMKDEAHQPSQAFTLRLDVFDALLQDHWRLSRAERERWLNQTASLLNTGLYSIDAENPDRMRWRSLLDLKKHLDVLRPQALEFMTKEWPALQLRMRERGTRDIGDLIIDGDHAYLMASDHQKVPDTLVAVIDRQLITSSLNTVLDDVVKPLGISVHWRFQNARHPSALLEYEREVNVLFPGLRLQLYVPSNTSEETLAHHRIRLYALMIGLSTTVLLVGVTIMILAIRKDVQMAHLKSEFVSNLSHQIRTPLYAITMISERLDMKRYRSTEEAESFYVMLREEADRLKDLVDQALSFSKLMDGRWKLDLIPMDLRASAEQAMDACRHKVEARGLTMTSILPSDPLLVTGDARSLVQALINLLDNAIKYSPTGSRITVSLKRDGEQGVVSIHDEGAGIPEAEQSKIFEKFYRVESTSDSVGGVGLGLAIVEHVVKAHHGTIRVHSVPGQGSTFILGVPLGSLAMGQAEQAEA